MTEQFYINGILMEQASGKSASLVYQSPFFTEIDYIISNRTNSVNFPTTENNLAAIQHANLPAGTSKFAYRKHAALYFRDGVQIFSGYGTLLGISPTEIKFSFTWGNVNAFQQLLDIKLRDLQTNADYIGWNDTNVQNSNYFPTNVKYATAGYNGSQYTTVGHTHPMLKVSDIITRLASVSGISFSGHSAFNNLAIPILSRIADDKAKAAQGINIVSGNTAVNALYLQHAWAFAYGSGDRDLKSQYVANGAWDVTDYNKVRITLKAGSAFKTYQAIPSGVKPIVRGINVYACDEDGVISALISRIPMSWNDLTANSQRVQYSVSEDKTINIDLNWESGGNSGKYNYIQLVPFICGDAYYGTASVYDISVDIDIVCDYDQEQEVIYGGLYPLYSNLPDWTASQLLKNLMRICGLFAKCPDSQTIQFVSIDTLYNNRETGLDWTEKMMLEEGVKPTEMTPTFGSFAQRNLCKWAEDKTNTMTFDGALTVDDENLESEKDLFQLDFAGTDYEVSGENETLRINCYSVNSDGDDNAEGFEEVTPRIFEIAGRVASFADLDFKNIATGAYQSYQKTIDTPRVLKVRVLVDALDLANLDLSVPVYSHALGHWYAINKLTTKDAYSADAELLQLGELETEVAEMPTSTNPTDLLQLVRNDDDTYYASIPSMTGAMLNTIINSADYRVVVLRYGYARRGKWFKYHDNRNVEVWSHTHRSSGYKNDRKGLTWRIIGRDILYEGSQPSHSQQTVTGYYAGATLVFKLKDTISLPNMRTHQPGFVTADGRIRNRSCDGLNELYIALYHYENKSWLRCSNIVQVRGRNSGKTKVWEYEESNIVYSAV